LKDVFAGENSVISPETCNSFGTEGVHCCNQRSLPVSSRNERPPATVCLVHLEPPQAREQVTHVERHRSMNDAARPTDLLVKRFQNAFGGKTRCQLDDLNANSLSTCPKKRERHAGTTNYSKYVILASEDIREVTVFDWWRPICEIDVRIPSSAMQREAWNEDPKDSSNHRFHE
jgi:hypothetical protein